MEQENLEKDATKEDPPPIFKKWAYLYAIVIGNLLLLVVLFYWFSKSLS